MLSSRLTQFYSHTEYAEQLQELDISPSVVGFQRSHKAMGKIWKSIKARSYFVRSGANIGNSGLQGE